MFKVIVWRFGKRVVSECVSKPEAYRFANYGTEEGLHYFECLLDETDTIIYDNKEKRKGQKYIFS